MIWRANRVSKLTLVLLTALCIGALVLVGKLKVKMQQPYLEEKLAAAKKMKQAMDAIGEHQRSINGGLDNPNDPTNSGLIGVEFSEITSDVGNLESKQTYVNPNLAALMVLWLKRANLQRGDVVAIGISGSFPAGNIAALAACETLALRPLVITSAGASMYGANTPEFTWLDMESLLLEKKILKTRTLAATLGAGQDIGLNLSARGRQMLIDAIKRNNIPFLDPADLKDSVTKRMQVYQKNAKRKPIKLYINVGGGLGSVGSRTNMRLISAGLNRNPRKGIYVTHGPMTLFADRGIPVINFVRIRRLAPRYGLPIAPTQIPLPGEGDLFLREEHNLWLAGALLLALAATTFIVVRVDAHYYAVRMHKLYQIGTGSVRPTDRVPNDPPL